MQVKEILNSGKVTLSFEVFPPKTSDAFEAVDAAVNQIAALKPDFMSVTYGAGGGTSAYTVRIAKNIKEQYGVASLAHLTCVSSTREQVRGMLDQMKENGIENVLALRGDIPKDATFPLANQYHYASELIEEIRNYAPNLCIGAACYPEGHPESANKAEDIRHLKEKVDAGVDFITTQMFFDNAILHNYLYRIREAGVNVPVCAGIMPVTAASQMKRIFQLSGTYLPARFKSILDRFGGNPAAMKQAGIAYATEQIIDLIANGVDHIHVYTMNKPEIAAQIQANLSEIINL
ncbi:MAG: methylenetetrahydrofolate reductase [Lachnospiraceae bacterium]|nr:methylenetetrahydrofolate reductase [NAD(P)H] [Lachnospiraceae bacterium]